MWYGKSLSLGYSKEIFDAELFGILKALKIVTKEKKRNSYISITIFSDFQTAIKRLLNDDLGPEQTLAIEIIRLAKKLIN